MFRRYVLAMALGISVLATVATLPAFARSQPSAQEKAKLHYDAAMIALKRNDLAGAEQELLTALEYDKANALIYFNLAVVQKSRSPDAALANLDSAEALGLPVAERRSAAKLRPQILYAMGKARRMFEGTWVWSDERTDSAISITEKATWTFEVSGPTIHGATNTAARMANHEAGKYYKCVGGHTSRTVDTAWSASLTVDVLAKPIKIEESSQATSTCSGTCCGDSDWTADSYRITSE